MNEQSKHNDFLPQVEVEQDMLALIRKMQQQLIFLEKKIDILINQFQGAPPREKYFSKSYRSFDRSHRHGKGERDSSSGERGFAQGRNFGKRHGEENRGFGQKKKPFYYGRRDRG